MTTDRSASTRPRSRPRLLAAAAAALAAGVVAALSGWASAELPEPRHDPDEVRALADEILSRPEFQPPPETWLQRIARWFAELFGDEPTPASPSSGGSGGSALLTALMVAVVVVVIVLTARALLGTSRRRAPVAEEPAVEIEERRSAGGWARAAERHEAAGEWKDGLRCRFRALVERLGERGAVPDIPGRTTGELRFDLAGATPGAAADFDAAAELFERAWYGDLPTGADEARRFAGHAERVLAGLDDRPSPDRSPAAMGAG